MKGLSLILPLVLAVFWNHVSAQEAAPAADSSQAAEWGPITLLARVVEPGTKQKFTFSPNRTFEASFLDTALWAARGVAPGPTLCVVSGIHGDEVNSVEIARQSFQAVDPQRLKGTMIVIPVANSLGFRTMNRYMIDRRDLNRAFPGSVTGSVTSLVANMLFERVIRQCNYLIDLHTGSNFRTNVAQIRVDMDDPKSVALAENFGVGVIIAGAGPTGSLRREAVKAGVAAIIYESGPPYAFVEAEIKTGTQGILNALDFLGMYATPGERPQSQKLVRSGWIRVPRGAGGIFLTDVHLGDAVKVGDLLGTVTDPESDEQVAIHSTRAGIVIGAALPQVVLSGYGLFHIGEIE